MPFRAIVITLTLLGLGSSPGFARQTSTQDAAPDARPQVLVLGVYHMVNAGNHVVDSEVDDVLASRRQAEIAELVAVLEEFQPTKIAVEAAFYDADEIASRYDAYLNGEAELTSNERQQIGFRLAKRLGHSTVYAVDADGEFPFPRLQDYAKARGHEEEFAALMDDLGDRADAWSAYLASHTVLEALLHMNSDEYAVESLAFDYRQANLGEPWNWAGPDLVSDWFRRNMRIYGNVLNLIESPDERILVIFGAGHLGWLRHNFGVDPGVRLRTLAELVR